MLKLITRIGLTTFLIYLWKANPREIKVILLSSLSVVLIFFFYIDFTEYLKTTNPDYLIYALLGKWLLVLIFLFLTIKTISNMQWSISLRKLKRINSESTLSHKTQERLTKAEKITSVKSNLEKYKNIEKYPILESEVDKILKDQ